MPVQYIHEPWTAPENVQRATKCIIGKDYPLPMVNHCVASKINIERMKQVYQQLITYKLLEIDKCNDVAVDDDDDDDDDDDYQTHLINDLEKSKNIH